MREREKSKVSAGDTRLGRRDFLQRSAMMTAAVAGPMIVPASVLGLGGKTAPSNRITMGCIGVGSQGTGNMQGFLKFSDVQVVAVADVDRGHRDNAKSIVDKTYGDTGCTGYNDFRELLDRGDLDTVALALPDHWHSIPSIMAARKGIDVYGEKPLALTLNEGKAIVDAVNRYNIVWQTGSWQRSQSHFLQAAELVRNGMVGEIHTVKVGLPTGRPIERQTEQPIPDGFDYDFWLGPAPEVPYTEQRCHWNWRWILDYSGGQLTDWVGHHGDIANWGMGTEDTGPISIEGRGIWPGDGLWNASTSYFFECIFAPSASPVAPKGFRMQVSNLFPMGTRFEGDKGMVFCDRGSTLVTEPEALKTHQFGPNDVRLKKADNHARDFFDCVRSREKTLAPVGPAHRAISLGQLGNIAMQLERKIVWDPATQTFPNDPEATRKMQRAMRGPWHI
ncbi:MAG: Gfo/Idh/MocA family oxidoreductase [Candidatus Hydrogenedentes bacterium]|nr:Gfo/Idh/MocA family oxidoreductase [Candidatus Hydrogenedentota bacterium]